MPSWWNGYHATLLKWNYKFDSCRGRHLIKTHCLNQSFLKKRWIFLFKYGIIIEQFQSCSRGGMADTLLWGGSERMLVWVQISSTAPFFNKQSPILGLFYYPYYHSIVYHIYHVIEIVIFLISYHVFTYIYSSQPFKFFDS